MHRVFTALALCLGMVGPVWADDALRVITTSGRGTVEAAPDMATISLGVTHQARLAGEAMKATSTAMQAIMDRLQTAGIAPRDMQTNNLSLQPVWQRQTTNSNTPPRITGYVARNNLSIRVRDLEALGGILDEVIGDGANTFNGLRFSLQEPEPLMAEARTAAVRDAVARATQLAKAAGVTLGPIQSITEGGGSFRPQMMEMAEARMAADVPVAAGELSLSAQVSIVFAITD